MAEQKIDPGRMADWGKADLPAPPPFNLEECPCGHRTGYDRPVHGHRQRRVAGGSGSSGEVRSGHPLDYARGHLFPGHLEPGDCPLCDVYRRDRLLRVHENQSGAQGSGAGFTRSWGLCMWGGRGGPRHRQPPSSRPQPGIFLEPQIRGHCSPGGTFPLEVAS